MADTVPDYTRDEVIRFLEDKCFEKFLFFECDGVPSAHIYTTDFYEISIEASGETIPEENRLLAVKVLKNLDEAVRKALPWLANFNVKHDRWNPDGLDAGFRIIGIYIGNYETGGARRPKYYGFTISFDTVNYYPCYFTVKYFSNIHPFSVEQTVS